MTANRDDELIGQWNNRGRDYMRRLNRLIADAREGRKTPKEKHWPQEPRKLDEAQAVLALVETAHREGRWRVDAPIADRAWEPFLDRFVAEDHRDDRGCQSINCVTILGGDEFLLRLGTAYQPGPALHLRGGDVRELPGVLAIAASRDHDLLLLARENGFTVSRGLEGAAICLVPWPAGVLPKALDCLQLSNDGRTIAFTDGDAVWLGQVDGVAHVWTRVYPNDAFLADIAADDTAEEQNTTVYNLSLAGDREGLAGDGGGSSRAMPSLTLKTAAGEQEITLEQVEATTIAGRYDGDGGTPAFVVEIGSDGELTVTQNVALDSVDQNDLHDTVTLEGLIHATRTVTDGDHVTTQAVDIADALKTVLRMLLNPAEHPWDELEFRSHARHWAQGTLVRYFEVVGEGDAAITFVGMCRAVTTIDVEGNAVSTEALQISETPETSVDGKMGTGGFLIDRQQMLHNLRAEQGMISHDGADEDEEEIESDGGFSDAMMHCALSPDGQFIAFGSQFYGHFIERIDGFEPWGQIGPRSEYPCCAWFSDDSETVALHSCHLYNGATLGVRISEIESVITEPYEEDEHTTLLDGQLRVYAAAWLPLGSEQDGFALAGASYLNVVSFGGTLRSATHFGSAAASIDYCSRTGTLVLGSYAGVLHVYDPSRQAEPDRAIGYRPIRELYRWILWKDRTPFRW